MGRRMDVASEDDATILIGMNDLIAKLVNEGKTLKAVMAESGLRKVDVMRICAEMKILTRLRKNANSKPRVWPALTAVQRKRADLREQVAAGKSPKQIAIESGVSTQAVYSRLKAAGIRVPPKPKKKDQPRMSNKYGMLMTEVRRLMAMGATRAFTYQKNNAKSRGIGWELTFAEWWGIWDASGKWEKRGRTKGCYVMGRFGDLGPYAVGNVEICTHKENIAVRESHTPSVWLHKTRFLSIDSAAKTC